MYPNEESSFGNALHDEDYDFEWKLDLGSGATESACSTPQIPQLRGPISNRPFRPPRSALSVPKEAERDCGICFELAVEPVRTLCCAHLFCAEHLDAWLHGPNSDGLCPACCAPPAPEKDLGLLELGHSALLKRPRSRSPSPSVSSSSGSSSTASTVLCSSYPSSPSLTSSSESDEEDATVSSPPALVHARALPTRHAPPHPSRSVLGPNGSLGSLARAAGGFAVVAVLAGQGRWAAQ
ncbi:hypothetical protein FB451DRAFT_1568198 [Mycena latifolia]|nr:hypothetical protein FB451DRAFT_1568198 [Mycena latifolia]